MIASQLIENESEAISRSLWSATRNPAPVYPPLQGTVKADVAIIGAGYTGLSAAIHLAERGAAVVVLEAESPGWGASGRNGGQVIPGLKEDPDTVEHNFGPDVGGRMVRFAGQAPDMVFGLIQRFGIDCQAVRQGWIQPAHSPKALAVLQQRVEQWARRAAPIELLSREETARLIGTSAYLGGALDRRGGAVHPLNYALGLAEAAARLGATIHGRSLVSAMRRDTGRWRMDTAGGSVTAEQVLMCTNGYTDHLADRLRRSVVPVRSVQVATAPLSENVRATILPEGHVASDMRRLMLYYRLDKTGRLVIGGRGAYGEVATRARMDRLRATAGLLFPQLGELSWEFHWGGYVAMTVDHFPHLNEVAPGVFAAVGYNGRGVAMASAMGKVLADKTTGMPERNLDFPVTRLRPLPLHGLRKPIVSALVAWNAMRDGLELKSTV